MANHEAVAALPVTGNVDKAALRALLTRRFAYSLDASESATDFVAVDPASGVVPLYLIQNSTLFAYDSTDSTTAHDGATCLVSFEGKRFKSDTIAPPYSVLDKDTTRQPGIAWTHTIGTQTTTANLSAGYTEIDRSVALTANDTITEIGVYSTDAATYVLKIVKRNSVDNYDIVVSESFAHPGGGFANLTLSSAYTVPASGDYYVGGYSTNAAANITASTTRTIKIANMTGNGVTGTTEDATGGILAFRVVRSAPSPSVGDRYLIPTAATGTDWAGKDGKIGIYTAAGWRFATSPIGRFVYVEDETAFYHRNTSGAWTAGVGSIALSADSVNITNVLGADASFVVKVENQTTNAPPASPVAPVAYVIGPSPTGSWAGNAGKVAVCLVDGAFTILTPTAGDMVYDKSLAALYQFTGSAWVSQLGLWRSFSTTALTQSGNLGTLGSGSAGYAFSSGTAPTTSNNGTSDLITLSHQASRTGARLRVKYSATITGSINSTYTAGVYIGANSAATDWQGVPMNGSGGWSGTLEFILTAPDALAHTYSINISRQAAFDDSVPIRRRITIEEQF